MPNLRSQEVSDKGIRMIASDGREFFMSPGQIKKQYDDTLATKRTAMKLQAVGPIPRSTLDRSLVEAKAETATWLKSSIVAALGPEQISLASIVADFREADGVPTQLEIG